jgi:peptidoglycan/xylan/chitin deacetylase (PgdA/CDA1 family)
LLLTFDDCYQDLLDSALPILEEKGIPAVAFAVSGCLGGTNRWDHAIGAPELPLLDAAGLRILEQRGMEVGVHSRTHPRLTRITAEELLNEIRGSVADIKELGLKPPRLLAYPYGERDERVLRAARQASLEAAFTVEPGYVRPGQDVYQIPRIEILRGDVGWRFRLKIALAGRLPVWSERWRSLFSRLWQRLKLRISSLR